MDDIEHQLLCRMAKRADTDGTLCCDHIIRTTGQGLEIVANKTRFRLCYQGSGTVRDGHSGCIDVFQKEYRRLALKFKTQQELALIALQRDEIEREHVRRAMIALEKDISGGM